ncbi:hypothetical protein IFR05_005236 [Cadophora sp. M221]|nr:hypothetical protein IFR05_005236 [Cadophora sp. M221]
MLALSPSLGCSSTDAACLCRNVNLAYGVRDCANAVCSPDEAPSVIAFIVAYSAGVAIDGGTATGTDAGTATRTFGSTATQPKSPQTISSTSGTKTTSTGSPAPDSTISQSRSSSPSSSQPSPSSPATETTTPISDSSTQSLSTGAKAGIGAGVGVGVLILCVLIYIMILLRRSHYSQQNLPRETPQPGLPELGPGLTPEMETVERTGELDGKGAKDIKDSILFWRKDKPPVVSELQG